MEKFISLFLTFDLDFDAVLGPLEERIANFIGELHKADFVGRGTLKLTLLIIHHHIMADDDRIPKYLLFRRLRRSLISLIGFLEFGGFVVFAIHPCELELHLIGGQSARLIRQHIVNKSQLLDDGHVEHLAGLINGLVVHLFVERDEDTLEELDDLERHIHGNRDDETEEQEASPENKKG